MSIATGKAQCSTCGKERSAVRCEGCSRIFCYNHLADHRQELNQQLDEIELNRDLFRQTLTQQTLDSRQHSSTKQIDQWEEDSIKQIQEAAQICRDKLFQYTTGRISTIEVKLTKLTDALKQARQENDVNEIDLKQFKEQLTQLREELDKTLSISIGHESATLINKISVSVPSGEQSLNQLQQLLEQSSEKPNAKKELLQNEIHSVQHESNEQDDVLLKTVLIEPEKRCVHYQNSEIEFQRQITVYKDFVNELQREVRDLTERLQSGSDEYNALYRECMINKSDDKEELITAVTPLSNATDLNEQRLITVTRDSDEFHRHQNKVKVENQNTTSLNNYTDEISECPMCYWEFPRQISFDEKKEHIDRHFV